MYCGELYSIESVLITWFLLFRSSRKPVIDPSKPLPPQATFRGPYINTGSRDVGPDHRTYSKKWFILWRTCSWCKWKYVFESCALLADRHFWILDQGGLWNLPLFKWVGLRFMLMTQHYLWVCNWLGVWDFLCILDWQGERYVWDRASDIDFEKC